MTSPLQLASGLGFPHTFSSSSATAKRCPSPLPLPVLLLPETIFKRNPLILTTQVKGALFTGHRRNLYFKKHFFLIGPIEYWYDRTHKCIFLCLNNSSFRESTETGTFFKIQLCSVMKLYLTSTVYTQFS